MIRFCLHACLLLMLFSAPLMMGGGIGHAQDTPAGGDTLSPVPSTLDTLNSPFDYKTVPDKLGSGGDVLREKGPSAIDPADIPDILMNEMKEIEKNCRDNYFYSSFHDCRCIAVKFLDERLKSNPETAQSTIFKRINAQCPDKVAIAGFIYRSCYDFMKFHRPQDYVAFCECTARDVAEKYAERPAVNLHYIERLRRNAFKGCGLGQNPQYTVPPPEEE